MVALRAMSLCGSQGHTVTWLPWPVSSHIMMSVNHVLQFARMNLIIVMGNFFGSDGLVVQLFVMSLA